MIGCVVGDEGKLFIELGLDGLLAGKTSDNFSRLVKGWFRHILVFLRNSLLCK